jgi:5,5'-dehydrodivanillate O-demethylase
MVKTRCRNSVPFEVRMERHDQHHMAQLRLLTRTGPDTLMGKLLRRFWHPIATSAHLQQGTARAIRLMCEDLTLYRGESGHAFLIGGRCAHRCTVLHTGWVQGDHVRCMYHGWQYDGNGRCTEMPAERTLLPDVRVAGYPVHEYAGLIFAYMGEGEPPEFELPRKDVLERPGYDISSREAVWDCNWLQQVENSLDALHVSFVHRWPAPTSLGEQIGAAPPQLDYEETEAGIRQTAIRPNGIRVSNWTFPNNNNVSSPPPAPNLPWIDTTAWAVPIDDENTLRFGLTAYPGGEIGEEVRRVGGTGTGQVLEHYELLFKEHRLPELSAIERITAQDYAAVRGQGVVHDRAKERLASSDAGIALLRRIMFREMNAIEGGMPTKRWARIEAPELMQGVEPVS